MGYKYSFVNDATYSAADINEITRRLVTGGIEDPFTDGTPHNLKCFNLLNSNMVTSGIVPESDTTLKVEKMSSTMVLINPGTAFFNNGMTLTVDVNKIAVEISAGVYNYVYLEYDEDGSTAHPTSSVTEPTGDIVMLAHVDKDGNVIDKRSYAVGKLPKYISGYNLPKVTTFKYTGPGTYTIDMQGDKYRYFIIRGDSRTFTNTRNDSLGMWNVFNNRYIYTVTGAQKIYTSDTEMLIRVINSSGDCGGKLSLSYSGNILTLNISQIDTNACNGELEITAI